MRREIFVTVAVLLAGLATAGSPSRAVATNQYPYVGHDFHFIGTAIAAQATGVALQGEVRTVAASDRMTITVDDAVVGGKTMHVDVTSRSKNQHLCVAENTPTAVTGLTPGENVTIWVMDVTYWNDCDSGATTGILTISQ